MTSTYQQGDIVSVHFPFTDISQTKKRPALILSNAVVNQTGDYLMVQITSQFHSDGLSLPITAADFAGPALPLTSYIRVHKVFLLNESLIDRRFSAIQPGFRQTIINKLLTLIS
ncbi:type II toxin-antitoxin system PemK/MazF family toxin [Fibrella aquatilis]|uniref:Type II toxin-antitoxin system PemK/MazF family toxin n=1 Tax=Fibrella aquatilis TaxID=2817059 RepID=A0A939G8E8_9BACT|nr:type II toxin-antitoxin system PemK/MazF family toxin [Fibrella aquatilis]MBO0934332.1 type II toxin-antitoxin system PemK/MazF family toxin [Fibrella aquatilis]